MTRSITNILCVAGAEARTAIRLVRFWTAVFVITIVAGFGYALACLSLHFLAPYTPSTATPLYLLGNIEPTYFLIFQLVVLLMVFDSSQQQSRSRIDEVLNSKPVSNFEYFAGRILGNTLLLWAFAAVLVLTAHGFGLVASLSGLGFGEPFQAHSLFNLLVIDIPIMFLIWCAFTVFLASLLRLRVAVVVVGVLTMFGWLVLLLDSPFSLRGIVSPSSNDVLFISDLLPEFPRWETLAIRFGTVMGAIALLFATTALSRRRDRSTRLFNILASGVCTAVCVIAYGFAFIGVLGPGIQSEKWLIAHKQVSWNGGIDLTEISGQVHINPGRDLQIDLKMDMDIGDIPSKMLVFSFNPAMTISNIELDGRSMDYTFEDGLLQIPVEDLDGVSDVHSLIVQAQGALDKRFAYFDSTVDYLNSNDVPIVAPSLLGIDGSVFTRNYVALMPGNHWYPTPGPANNDFETAQRGLDYFRVNLDVSLSRDKWTLVAPGSEEINESSERSFKVSPVNPVHEMGLFASEFVSSSIDVGDLRFEIHLHKRHSKNIGTLLEQSAAFARGFENRIARFTEDGIVPAHSELALVEIPRRLRTIGGGWRMNSANALPGIVMMKEHGFPRARIDLALKRITKHFDEEQTQIDIGLSTLFQLFNSPVLTDSLWLCVPHRFWSNSTTASGPHAQSLDQIVQSLIVQLFELDPGFASVYSTMNIAAFTNLNLGRTVWSVDEALTGDATYMNVRDLGVVSDFGSRASVQGDMEQVSLANLPSDNGSQSDLELMLLKSSEIARSLLMANSSETVVLWIRDMRKSFAGRNYSLDDLIAFARKNSVKIDPFLTDWLDSSRLPGFMASTVSNTRIKDDENGIPQWMTSVDVRNSGNSSGVVVVQYLGSERNPWGSSMLEDSQAVFIDSGITKRINLVTSYPLKEVQLDPGLSLNRSSWTLEVNTISETETKDMELPPFVEDSSWTPPFEGIVVDDLSSGFQVFQPDPNYSMPSNIGPSSWFREPRLQLNMDAGLPSMRYSWYGTWQGVWARRELPAAFGAYRKTAVATQKGGSTFGKVRFSTELPEATDWKLEYYLPYHDQWFLPGREYKYIFVIHNSNSSWNAELDSESAVQGWNIVDSFELNDGATSVELVGVSETWRNRWIYADAIRWSKTDSNKLLEQ